MNNLNSTDAGPGAYYDAFMARFDPAGVLLWAKSTGGPLSSDVARDIVFGPEGSLYITGTFALFTDTDPDPDAVYTLTGGLTSQANNSDSYVLKLDAAGQFVWAGDLSEAGSATGIAANGLGLVAIVGFYSDTADLNPLPADAVFHLTAQRSDGYLVLLGDHVSSGNSTRIAHAGGYATDAGNNGSFEAVATDDDIWTRDGYSTAWQGLIEFDLNGVDRTAQVQSATLTVRPFLLEASSLEPQVDIGIYAYAGDGVLTPADATAPALHVATVTDVKLSPLTISLDAAKIQPLLLQGSHLGLTIRLLQGSGIALAGTESFWGAPPALSLTMASAATEQAPVARNDAYLVYEDSTLTVPAATGVLSNDEDRNDDLLTAVLYTQPTVGTLTFKADGSFTYNPQSNLWNMTTSFRYRTFDGTSYSQRAEVFLVIKAVDDPPTGTPDSYTVREDDYLFVNSPGPLANDSDIDTPASALTAVLVTGPAHGVLSSFDATGWFSYKPSRDFAGSDSFTYRVRDYSGGLSDPVTVTIVVQPVNDEPTFSLPWASVTVNEDFGLLTDPNFATNIRPGPATALDEANQVLTFYTSIGTPTGNLSFDQAPKISPNGTLTFAPAANTSGSVTVSVYLMDNGGILDGGDDTSPTRSFMIFVNAVNAAPTLDPIPDTFVWEDSAQHGVNLTGISAGMDEGSTQSVAITVTSSNPAVVPDPVVAYTNPNSTGTLRFAPVADASGTATITVRVRDSGGTANGGVDEIVRTFRITVGAVNDAPVAVTETYAVVEGVALTIGMPGVLGNDTDIDGDGLTAVLITSTTHGTLTLNANGSFTYTPEPGFSGTDAFTYCARDAALSSAEATVTLNAAPNSPPVAVPDTYSTLEDTPLVIEAPGVLSNDGDLEGATLSASLVTAPTAGAVTLNANGSFTYTPAANFNGADSFT